MYSVYTYSVMRAYSMYNMYCRDFAGPIYNRIAKNPEEEKYSLDGAANGRRSLAPNDYFLVSHEEVPGSNPGKGKQLVFFKVYSNSLL